MSSAPYAATPAHLNVVAHRPTAEQVHELAAVAPGARTTRYGSVNVATRLGARSRGSTVWVCDSPYRLPGPTLSRLEADRLARVQDEHLGKVGAIVVDGYLGASEPVRMPVRLVAEAPAAPLAAMQRHVMFDPVIGDGPFTPELTVVVTPGITAPGTPDGTMVAVWLDEGVTRVLGSDFFGETKKAMTRMWAERVYDAGGMVLHAACMTVPSREGPATVVVTGPPDSGKSSLVLHGAAGVRLVQDDFVCLLPGGQIVPAEDGCIEKTARLDPRRQPVLHAAATRADAYLENVVQHGRDLDFAAPDGPRHARVVFPLRAVGGVADAPVPPLGLLVVLEPGDELCPAVLRLPVAQAPAHFLLRERHLGLAEATGRLGNRLAALLGTSSADVVVVNPSAIGRDGADHLRGHASAAVVGALVDGLVEWESDLDAGAGVARTLPGVNDPELLWPRRRFSRLGTLQEYDVLLDAQKAQRRDYLAGFVGLDPAIVAAVT